MPENKQHDWEGRRKMYDDTWGRRMRKHSEKETAAAFLKLRNIL